MNESKIVIVITTEADILSASNLANILLERKLAACISFSRITSLYWWKDQLVSTKEVKLIIKTSEKKIHQMELAIRELHSYENPEFIWFYVNSNNDYKNWILETIV